MKPSLQLRLSQHLALTPQLQQSIRLLQLSTLELNSEIEKMLLDNPLLEREGGEDDGGGEPAVAAELAGTEMVAADADFSAERIAAISEGDFEPSNVEMPDTITEAYDSVSDDDIGEAAEWRSEAGSGNKNNDGDDDSDFQEYQTTSISLRDHLDGQVALMPLSDRDRALVRLIIEALEEDGYLAQGLEELLPVIPEEWEVELEELVTALRHVQHFDPVGVGARSLQECLLLQLKALPRNAIRDLAIGIIEHCLDSLAARDFVKISPPPFL